MVLLEILKRTNTNFLLAVYILNAYTLDTCCIYSIIFPMFRLRGGSCLGIVVNLSARLWNTQIKHFQPLTFVILGYSRSFLSNFSTLAKGNVVKKLSRTLAAKLYGAFALSLFVTLIISAFSVYQVREIDRALSDANIIREKALEPLYVAREALDQTGIAARNAYIFADPAAAQRELQELDKQRQIYLNALPKLEESVGKLSQFSVVRAGLKQMSVELNRPRKYIVANDHDGYGAFLVDECTPLRRKIVADMETLLQQLQVKTREAKEPLKNSLSRAKVSPIAR